MPSRLMNLQPKARSIKFKNSNFNLEASWPGYFPWGIGSRIPKLWSYSVPFKFLLPVLLDSPMGPMMSGRVPVGYLDHPWSPFSAMPVLPWLPSMPFTKQWASNKRVKPLFSFYCLASSQCVLGSGCWVTESFEPSGKTWLKSIQLLDSALNSELS